MSTGFRRLSLHFISLVILFGSVSFVSPLFFSQIASAVENPDCISGELYGGGILSTVQIKLLCTDIVKFVSSDGVVADSLDNTKIKLQPGDHAHNPIEFAMISGDQLLLNFQASDGTRDRDINIDAGTFVNSLGVPNAAISLATVDIIDYAIPNTVDDYYSISDSELGVLLSDGVLANDSDAESSVHDAIVMTDPTYGDLILNADGSFEYSPYQDYYGPDSFTYSAVDDAGNSNTATVYISDGQAEFSNVSFYSDGLNGGYAKVGDTVQVDFETSEPVTVDSVIIAGNDVAAQVIDETHFSANYVMQESDIEGSIIYSINVHDFAGQISPYSNSDTGIDIIFDKTAPVIDLGGEDYIEVNIPGEVYEETVFATDDSYGLVDVIIVGSVNADAAGTYEIVYSAIDAAGNQAETATRTVKVIDSIALAFDEISNNLAAIGIANNLNEVTTINITNFMGLYFEKSIDGVKMGRITFTGPLDLSDVSTIAFLQAIGLRMEANLPGTIGLNLMGISGSEVFQGMAATIKFYGLDKLGFDKDSTSADVFARLLAADDDGNAINILDLTSTPGVYVGCSNSQIECYTFTVGVGHFTKYNIDNVAPIVTINEPTSVMKGNDVTFTGVVNDLDSELVLKVGNKTYTILDADITGSNWSYKISTNDFEARVYQVEISATDPVGNIGVDTTRLKIKSTVIILHDDNTETMNPALVVDFNPGFVINNSFSQSDNVQPTQGTLGAQTTNRDGSEVIAPSSSNTAAVLDAWSLFGVAWYWWLLMLIVILLTWLVLG